MSEESLIEAQAPEGEGNEEQQTENQETGVQEEQGEAEDAPSSEDGYLYAGKYKSTEDLEKGYKELAAKLREKSPGAPEGDYEFDFSNNEALSDAEIDLDEDAIFNAAIPAFKKAGVSQEQAQLVVEAVLEATYEQMPDIGTELEKLGPNGAEIVSDVNKFVHKTFNEAEKDSPPGAVCGWYSTFTQDDAIIRGEVVTS